jgi:hypothetical protein
LGNKHEIEEGDFTKQELDLIKIDQTYEQILIDIKSKGIKTENDIQGALLQIKEFFENDEFNYAK